MEQGSMGRKNFLPIFICQKRHFSGLSHERKKGYTAFVLRVRLSLKKTL